MLLKEFITTVLIDIIKGVENFKSEIEDKQTGISYSDLPGLSYSDLQVNNLSIDELTKEVEFDVLLRTHVVKGNKEGIGVFFPAVELGTNNDSKDNMTSQNRIKFKVPVTFIRGIK
jgi:hypothetical protein